MPLSVKGTVTDIFSEVMQNETKTSKSIRNQNYERKELK